MFHKLAIAAAVTGLLASSSAPAKPYVDYTPQKGMWNINAIEVDPNHVDEYLEGLRKSQVPALEVMKAHGLIDDYRFMVRGNYIKGTPNVLIQTHYPSGAMLDPNQARDEAIDKDIRKLFTEAQDKTAVAGYEKYRTFIDEGLWGEVKMVK